MVRVLVIEDDELKHSDVVECLTACLGSSAAISRAANAVDAEKLIDDETWDLLVLDISMNISRGSLGPLRGGHANTGGLQIAERMYLLGRTFPTVVLTGFEFFKATGGSPSHGELIGLSVVEERARKYFGSNLLGCIRYGAGEWRAELTNCIEKVARN